MFRNVIGACQIIKYKLTGAVDTECCFESTPMKLLHQAQGILAFTDSNSASRVTPSNQLPRVDCFVATHHGDHNSI